MDEFTELTDLIEMLSTFADGQAEDMEESEDELYDEEKGFYLIRCGPYGVKWSSRAPPLDEEVNPLMYTCACCRKTSFARDDNAHEPGCRTGLLLQLGI